MTPAGYGYTRLAGLQVAKYECGGSEASKSTPPSPQISKVAN